MVNSSEYQLFTFYNTFTEAVSLDLHKIFLSDLQHLTTIQKMEIQLCLKNSSTLLLRVNAKDLW